MSNASIQLAPTDVSSSRNDATTTERAATRDNVRRPTLRSEKIRDEHLQRTAIVYVRQSTQQQVLEHRESTARQYALADRAVALGWPSAGVEVIDRTTEERPKKNDRRHTPWHRVLGTMPRLGRIGEYCCCGKSQPNLPISRAPGAPGLCLRSPFRTVQLYSLLRRRAAPRCHDAVALTRLLKTKIMAANRNAFSFISSLIQRIRLPDGKNHPVRRPFRFGAPDVQRVHAFMDDGVRLPIRPGTFFCSSGHRQLANGRDNSGHGRNRSRS